MSGQQIGGVVGGVIGAWATGGSPQGFQYGYAIGSIVGGIVKPDVIKGPSLGDAQQQTSQAGRPIPFILGHSVPFAGTIVDGDPKARKVKRRSRAGKGGPIQENEGWVSTRLFLLCESPNGEADVVRIRRNGKLIFSQIADDPVDADSAAFRSQMTILRGGDDQLPHPALEAIHGVGNTPYYRGVLCVLIEDDDETQTDGAANQYSFEVAGCRTSSVIPGSTPPWLTSNTGLAQTIFDIAGDGNGVWMASGWNNNLRWSPDGRQWEGIEYSDDTGIPVTDVLGNIFYDPAPARDPGWYITRGDTIAKSVTGRFWHPHMTALHPIADGSIGNIGGAWWGGVNDAGNTRIFQPLLSTPETVTDYGADYGIPCRIAATGQGQTLVATQTGNLLVDGELKYSSAYPIRAFASIGAVTIAARPGAPYLYSLDGGGTWAEGALNLYSVTTDGVRFFGAARESIAIADAQLAAWTTVDTSFAGNELTTYIEAAGGEVLAVTSGGLTAVYKAVALPDAPDYLIDLTTHSLYGPDRTVITPCVPEWRTVVAAIAARCNVPASVLDIDSMTDAVPSYMLGDFNTPGTEYLRELCTLYFTDLPEYDGQIHAIRRAGPIVATITDDDLLEVEDDDDDNREQTLDFPGRVTVYYPDPANNYVVTPQVAERTSPDVQSSSELNVQCTIPFDGDTVAQKADILQKIAFSRSEGSIKRALPAEFSRLVPSDPIMIRNRRHMVTKASYDDCMVRIEADYDRASAYQSLATGATAPAPQPPVSNIKGPTLLAAMNLPSLRTADNVPGMYLAVRGVLDGWPGSDIELSVDEGASWDTVARMTDAAVMGTLTADLAVGGGTLSVRAPGEVLESVTDAQIALRKNALAVLTSGVAELLQFKTAADTGEDTFDLTDLTRAGLGTAEADHYVGNTFVLLETGLLFLPLNITLAGKTLWFRAVTLGTAPDNNAITKVVFDPQFTGPETLTPIKVDGVPVKVDGAYLYRVE